MKQILFTLILFVSLSQIGLAQEEKSKDSQSFENAFIEAGEKLVAWQKDWKNATQTENALKKELFNNIQPLFKTAFKNEFTKRGNEINEQANAGNFQGSFFTIGKVNHLVGEILADSIRSNIFTIFTDEWENYILKYSEDTTNTIEEAENIAIDSATRRTMVIYKKTVENWIKARKREWAKIPEKSNLQKAADAAEEKEFMEAISLVKKARDNGKIGDKQVGEHAIDFAVKALSASFYKDAIDLANIAYNHDVSEDSVNRLKYQIYDKYYQSAKDGDNKALRKKLKKARKKYKKWKP